jgi:tripartite motif-containing protein 71
MGDRPTVTHQLSFGRWGSRDGDFDKPCGLALDTRQELCVADAGNGRVQLFDPQGKFLRAFGRGEGGWLKKVGKLIAPAGVAVDAAGACYVTDVKLGLCKFDRDGHFVGSLTQKGKREGQLDWPRGVHFDLDGSLWVVDAHNHRVQRFDTEGRFLSGFGEEGDDPSGGGKFNRPSDLAIDSEGYLYVTDTLHSCVQKFDRDGRFLAKLGSPGSGDGQLWYPRGIAIDGAGRIYVVERMNHRVQVFDRDGRFLCTFGSQGKRDGQFNEPYGIAIDDQTQVYVTDNGGNRVQRFSLA